ncbi:MAG: tetratricopeptide repeat protein [Myxococcales bacterium]
METEQADKGEQGVAGPVRVIAPGLGGAERELIELRREVLESRNLVIKTDNLLRGLHAEVKAFGKRQEEAERHRVFASAAAYACFAALCAGGAALAARGFVASAQEDAAQARRDAASAVAGAAQLRSELGARQAASEAAARAYAKVAGDAAGRLDGLAAVGQLDRKLLTPLEVKALDDRASQARREAAAAALESGRAAFRHNDFKGAAAELGRYFQIADPAGADVLASLDLGVALWQQRAFAPAAAQLERFLALGKGLKNRDYAALLLGESLEGAGRAAQAEDVYKSGIAEHSQSEFAPQMRHRLYKLEHQEPPSGTAKAAPGPAPAAG